MNNGMVYLVIGAAACRVEDSPASLTPDLWVGPSAVGIWRKTKHEKNKNKTKNQHRRTLTGFENYRGVHTITVRLLPRTRLSGGVFRGDRTDDLYDLEDLDLSGQVYSWSVRSIPTRALQFMTYIRQAGKV